MAHDIPEKDLVWFRDKGILVKKCSPIHNGKESGINYPPIDSSLPEDTKFHMNRFKNLPVILNKFELFTPEFKKWDTVLYLDCDIIVRYSLEELTKVSGFAAVLDDPSPRLINQFLMTAWSGPLFKELEGAFDVGSPAFNSGVMAFSTDIIEENSFKELCNLFQKYHTICNLYGEQPILNLYFSERWKRLSCAYNFAGYAMQYLGVSLKLNDAIVFHLYGNNKPWLPGSSFNTEWKNNLQKAEEINLNDRHIDGNIFTITKMVRITDIFYKIDRLIDVKIGLMGIFLKKYYPSLYWLLKK